MADDSEYDPKGRADGVGADTTSWGGGIAPPRILDEAATSISEPASIAGRPSNRKHPLQSMWLERIDPSFKRGEQIRLDPGTRRVRVGRAESNEIRLYTGSTSREHAIIEANEAGDWVLIPLEGKNVHVDGDLVSEPMILEAGMNLVLGADHLRCVLMDQPVSEASEPTANEGPGKKTRSLWRSDSALWKFGIAILLWSLGVFFWFID